MNEPILPSVAPEHSGISPPPDSNASPSARGEFPNHTAYARFVGGYFMGTFSGFIEVLRQESVFGHALVVGLMTGLILGSSCALFGKGFFKFVIAFFTCGGIY